MNLRSLDLNLLLIFDAVYGERSISRAAEKLHLSQPTVSNALTRLRERLNDPLFERSAQGMLPTMRAKSLAEPIRQALDLLEGGLRGNDEFQFRQSDREFVVAVEDYGEAVVLPRFCDWLSEVAPNIRITIRPDSSKLLQSELRDGSVDLAFDYFVMQDPSYENRCVLTETLLCLSRRDHPDVGEKMTLDTYLALRHVVLAPRVSSKPMIDLALAKRGLKRKISVTVPHFLSMPMLVQMSSMLCTLPRRMANLYADHFRLMAHAVPIRTPQFPVYLIWHESMNKDPGHQWLRKHLMEFCQRL